jgi:hypothetical protein
MGTQSKGWTNLHDGRLMKLASEMFSNGPRGQRIPIFLQISVQNAVEEEALSTKKKKNQVKS